MKKFLLFIAVAASAGIVSSCRNDILDTFPGGDGINVSVTGNPMTKSSSAVIEEPLFSIPITSEDWDGPLYVNGYVSDMDGAQDYSDVATKGTLITSGNIGLVTGFDTFKTSVSQDGETYVSNTKSMAEVTAVYDADSTPAMWNLQGGPYFWPEDGSDITFCSWAPSVCATRTSLVWDPAAKKASFNYALPAPCTASPYKDAQNQKDLLFAISTANKNSEVRDGESYAQIHFYHALTALRFTRGELPDCKINAIELENFYADGSAEFDASGTTPEFTWTIPSGATARTFRQDFGMVLDDNAPKAASDTDKGSSIDPTDYDTDVNNDGEMTFMMIPQVLPTDAKINIYVDGLLTPVTLNIGSLDSSVPANAKLKDWSAYAGKIITIRIESELGGSEYDFYFTEGTDDASKILQARSWSTEDADLSDPEGGVIPVTSSTISAKPVALDWHIKSYKIGSADAVTVDGTSFTDKNGISVTKDGNNLKVTKVSKRTAKGYGTNDYWVNQNPERTDNLDWSPADWSTSKAKSTSPLDLSKFDFKTEAFRTMTTANTYIVRHAGTYKIPLVYGNGVVDGHINAQSYYPDVTGGSNRLARFVNHKGNGIISPFIEYNTDDGNAKSDSNSYLAPTSTAVVWQDQAAVLTIDGLSKEDITIDGTTYNISYLTFTIPQSAICQNNAVVAVKDADGVMWSWCIWTTNNPGLLSDPIKVHNHTSRDSYFFPLNYIGYVDAKNYPAKDQMVVTLEQSRSGKTIEVTIDQPEALGKASCNYYQFGRKDPMCGKAAPASGTYVKNGSGKVALQTAILNPQSFYNYGGAVPYDWCSTTYNNLWTGKQSSTGVSENDDINKTVYDPSPAGYQIPVSNAYTGFTQNGKDATDTSKFNVSGSFSNGWNFNTNNTDPSTIFFEAMGIIGHGSGSINDVGSAGYSWTAVPFNEEHGISLGFTSALVRTKYNYYRAHGIPVRPVLE